MDEFKKIVDGLLIKSIEEIMLQTGMEKYDILKMARKCGYKICIGEPSIGLESGS